MNQLPDLDFAAAELSAFAQARGLKGNHESWSHLAATAQLVMSYVQEVAPQDTRCLYHILDAIPIVAASRVLDAISLPASGLDPIERNDWAVTAMVAFGMWGNFLSAAAMRRRITGVIACSPALAAIVVTCVPHDSQKWIELASADEHSAKYTRQLQYFLRTGDPVVAGTLEGLLLSCIRTADTFDSSLLRSARLVLRHVITLSVVPEILRTLPNLGVAYAASLFDSKVRVFLPPQYAALADRKLATSDTNSLVALHTSAGKTLLGELCLIRSLDAGPGLAIFIAPWVALGRQVGDSFKAHCPPSVRVHVLVGGYRADQPLDPVEHRELVVATPERLDSLLRAQPEIYDHVRAVVVDEAHLVGTGVRGVRLEGLIARLVMRQQQGCGLRLVLLTAVTDDYDRLKKWLSLSDDSVIVDAWRPTARRVAIWSRDGWLRWYRGAEFVRPHGASNLDNLGGVLVPPPHKSFVPAFTFPQKAKQGPLAIENAAVMAEYLFEEFEEACLCICMRRATSRLLAATLAKRLSPIEPLTAHISRAVRMIESDYPQLSVLGRCLRSGVAYHNASLPHELRHVIEDAVRDREIRIVAATTTLAEGVDLPFRTTLVVEWAQWQGDRAVPMSPLLFRNISGRCGRAGRQTEGDTVVFDNPAVDAGIVHTPLTTEFLKEHYFGSDPVSVESSLETLRPGTSMSADALNALASQFLAAIPENSDDDDLVSSFAASLYWITAGDSRSRVRPTVNRVAMEILDSSSGALATAASPFKLTELGRASVRTGFSPESCRLIVSRLGKVVSEGHGLLLISKLITEFGQLSEQPDFSWRKELDKPHKGCRMKREDVETVVRGWIGGKRVIDLFLGLKTVKKSKSTVKIDEWIAGLSNPVTWDDEFDDFNELVSALFKTFCPWLIRACEDLSKIAGGEESGIRWRELSDFCEYGVDTRWAVAALKRNAPARREVLAVMGRVFDPFDSSDAPLVGLVENGVLQEMIERGDVSKLLKKAFGEVSREYTAAMRVITWWHDGA